MTAPDGQTAAVASFDAQRLAFGRAADLYDRVRPSYPAAAIDAIVGFGGLRPPGPIVEIGAGTGKATVLLAARGFDVLALEPSPAMAARARANCAGYGAVTVIETEFEEWQPPAAVPALVSAAAWHWIDPEARYHLAHRALAPGGTLAALWTFPDWERCRLTAALAAAYQRAAPQLAPDFPMHPGSQPTRLAGDWEAEIAGSRTFERPTIHRYAWERRYTGRDYRALLQTHQDHILLADDARATLLDAVGAVIADAGGTLALPLVTHVCLATRLP